MFYTDNYFKKCKRETPAKFVLIWQEFFVINGIIRLRGIIFLCYLEILEGVLYVEVKSAPC